MLVGRAGREKYLLRMPRMVLKLKELIPFARYWNNKCDEMRNFEGECGNWRGSLVACLSIQDTIRRRNCPRLVNALL